MYLRGEGSRPWLAAAGYCGLVIGRTVKGSGGDLDATSYVAPIRDTDTPIPIRRYFIFQNQGYADTTSIYIINNKYY
jgi:hypothetical protein